jgi:hypothetical protein
VVRIVEIEETVLLFGSVADLSCGDHTTYCWFIEAIAVGVGEPERVAMVTE